MMVQVPGRVLRRARRAHARARLTPISRSVSDARLTYLSTRSLRNLERCMATVTNDGVPGVFVECGVALGGSAIVMATLMPAERTFRGYDVFAMIPPPGENDGPEARERYSVIASGQSEGIVDTAYYGYEPDLYRKVIENFAAYGLTVDDDRIAMQRGLFEDTLRFGSEQVALAHIDSDWYDSVKVCLTRIYPHLAPGGFVISDDYFTFGGCTRAIDEFLEAHPDLRRVDDGQGPPNASANLILRRAESPG